ncbi:hypothetical protein RvY_12117 [Ramazzottius varieornatus]|uniref:Chitin-binding type-2 domain-containing protein n=1 Tax=Ramazzottius varieornatus TaxID=947166 RepID=A0A1D1VID3_RAMVA|nr:hypothetical protein RvY_12117 [Ramazzottius varieornatus]
MKVHTFPTPGLTIRDVFCLIALPFLISIVTEAGTVVKRQAGPPVPAQTPQVFQALDILRGSEPLTSAQIQQVLAYSYPGSSYPTYSYIPQTSFNCNQVRQFGFYADPETRCQVFRRCEANNYMFSYICPNGTVFNQITLICDWFYNVNCPSVGGFYDYSNPRIYRQDLRLFDDYYSSGYGGGGGGGYGGGSGGSGSSGGYGSSSSSYGVMASMGSGSGGAYAMSGSGTVGAAVPASSSQLTGTTITSNSNTYRIGLRSDHVTPGVTQSDQPTTTK